MSLIQVLNSLWANKRSRKFKAKQSPLFKKIKADGRNQKELHRMIQESGSKRDGVYKFFIDNELKEVSIKEVRINN